MSSSFLSFQWCRHKQGCVLQTLCRRGLFSVARKVNLQSAWTNFCWVECLVSEPPILPHWLPLRDLQSPTLSKRSNLVLYHQHHNSQSEQLSKISQIFLVKTSVWTPLLAVNTSCGLPLKTLRKTPMYVCGTYLVMLVSPPGVSGSSATRSLFGGTSSLSSLKSKT